MRCVVYHRLRQQRPSLNVGHIHGYSSSPTITCAVYCIICYYYFPGIVIPSIVNNRISAFVLCRSPPPSRVLLFKLYSQLICKKHKLIVFLFICICYIGAWSIVLHIFSCFGYFKTFLSFRRSFLAVPHHPAFSVRNGIRRHRFCVGNIKISCVRIVLMQSIFISLYRSNRCCYFKSDKPVAPISFRVT